jgi:Ca2+-binding RTX toxin-like protein
VRIECVPSNWEFAYWTDSLTCGSGYDQLSAMTEDRWSDDCERVLVHEVEPAPYDEDDPYDFPADFAVPVRLDLNGDNHANHLVGDPKIRGRIRGRGGNDRITGGGRRDSIDAGSGADGIRTIGGGRDVVSCGRGRDRVVADKRDRVGRDCERVRRR